MDTKFNVFEILQIAERIEHKGATFYLKMVDLFYDPACRDIYYKLARWKAKQQRVWARLRKRFSEKTGEFGTFDPDNYVLSNPGVMAGLTWFGTKQGSVRKVTGHESEAAVIRDAIQRENEIIVFYRGLKEFARDPASKDVVENTIRKEKKQIGILSSWLKQCDYADPSQRPYSACL